MGKHTHGFTYVITNAEANLFKATIDQGSVNCVESLVVVLFKWVVHN